MGPLKVKDGEELVGARLNTWLSSTGMIGSFGSPSFTLMVHFYNLIFCPFTSLIEISEKLPRNVAKDSCGSLAVPHPPRLFKFGWMSYRQAEQGGSAAAARVANHVGILCCRLGMGNRTCHGWYRMKCGLVRLGCDSTRENDRVEALSFRYVRDLLTTKRTSTAAHERSRQS